MTILRKLTISFLLVGVLLAILLVSARIYFARTGVEQAPGEPVLISITVAPSATSVLLNSSASLTATGYYSDGSKKDLTTKATWTSSDSAAVGIGANGVAKALKDGAVRIEAIYESQGGSAEVSVGPPALVAIAIAPAGVSIAEGRIVAFHATGIYSDGKTEDVTRSVDWSSSVPAVAAITSAGLATSQQVASTSSTIIRAAIANISTTTFLTVTPDANGFAGALTYRSDLARTGQNLNEVKLKLSNVNSYTFGKLFTIPIDGNLYGQPLYVPAVAVPGRGTHDLVYAATENNLVYAFDAENPKGETIWSTHLGPPVPAVKQVPGNCTSIEPNIGVTSTPVIDPATSTIYVVARNFEEPGKFSYHLHALDFRTGAERPGSPVIIMGSARVSAAGGNDKKIAFDPTLNLQRAGLALVNGNIVIGFGSDCDYGDFHGWLFSFDATTLKQTGIFLTTPTGENGGIWASGAAPAVDTDNHIFLITGDGTFDADSGGPNHGDSFLKFQQTHDGLSLLDYFTPSNQKKLDTLNLDLGSGGLVLLPDQISAHPHLLVGSGKDGTIYLLNRDSLGHYQATGNPQIVQLLPSVLNPVFSTPAVWQDSSHTWIYFGATLAKLRAYTLDHGVLSPLPSSQSQERFGPPGSSPVISADGTKDGIVWILAKSMGDTPTGGRAYAARLLSIARHPKALIAFIGRTLYMLVHPSLWRDYFGRKLPTIHTNQVGPVVLRAYDATNLADLLYSSDQAPNNRDQADLPVKFAVPIVANGRVYFGTQDHLDVYGLLK
jgi:Bacterial Ig-like domain (group 2)